MYVPVFDTRYVLYIFVVYRFTVMVTVRLNILFILSLFSETQLCSQAIRSYSKKKREGTKQPWSRLPLRLTSRASKKRDLETGSHAIGFLYRCRTFPIFNLIFFSCKQKISLATRCITPNLVQKDNIANSNKIRIPHRKLTLHFFFYKEMCARRGNACTQGIFQKLSSFGSRTS